MTVAELQSRVLSRIGEDPAAAQGNQYYTPAEALAALNMAHRLFALLTMCLETSGVLVLSPGVAYYQLLQVFPDWLLPLRIRGAKKLRPARLSDLAALDSTWSASPGDPSRYALVGFDLLGVYQQPTDVQSLQVTYARCPQVLTPSAAPEIPEEYHDCLVDGAIPLMRTKEGGQEWQKTLPLFDRFLSEAQRLGQYVRARNKEQAYDYLPSELARFDRSKLIEVTSGKQ